MPSIVLAKWDVGDYIPSSSKLLCSMKYITNDSYSYPGTYIYECLEVLRVLGVSGDE